MQVFQSNKSSIDFLLSDNKREETVIVEPKTVPKTSNPKIYKILRPHKPNLSIKIIQQPTHAKVTPRPPTKVFPPFAEHRPIHPPPVLQLKLEDFKPKYEDDYKLSDDLLSTLANKDNPKSLERVEELKIITKLRNHKLPSWTHYSTFFVIARLREADGQIDQSSVNSHNVQNIDDLLIGTKVSSGMAVSLRAASPSNSHLAKALPKETPHSTDFAITFVFSDLSVKKIGMFKLKFDLFEVYKGKIFWRNEIYSDGFQVFTPKKFPGSTPSTSLTTFLYKQGARIRQRKRTSNKRDDTKKDSQRIEESKSPSSQGSDSQPPKARKVNSSRVLTLYNQQRKPLFQTHHNQGSLQSNSHIESPLRLPPTRTLSLQEYYRQPFQGDHLPKMLPSVDRLRLHPTQQTGQAPAQHQPYHYQQPFHFQVSQPLHQYSQLAPAPLPSHVLPQSDHIPPFFSRASAHGGSLVYQPGQLPPYQQQMQQNQPYQPSYQLPKPSDIMEHEYGSSLDQRK